jgi:hypothetical protein
MRWRFRQSLRHVSTFAPPAMVALAFLLAACGKGGSSGY